MPKPASLKNRYILTLIIGLALTISIPMMLSQKTESQIQPLGVFLVDQSSEISVNKATGSNPKIIAESLNIPLKRPLFIDGYDHQILYYYISAEIKRTSGEFSGVSRVIYVNLEVSVDNGATWKLIGQARGSATPDLVIRDGSGGFASPVNASTSITQIKFRASAVGNGEIENVQAFVIPLVHGNWL